MKKWLVIIICFVIVAAAFLIAWNRYHTKNKYVPPQGDEETYSLTEEEVEQINASSNLLGCVLLADAPEEAMTAEPIDIDHNLRDYYMCFPYRKRHCITEINLFSEEANIFGMSVGDDVEKASSILLDAGYEMNDSSQSDAKIFRKYYIRIYFRYNDLQKVTQIGVSVSDPAYRDIVY